MLLLMLTLMLYYFDEKKLYLYLLDIDLLKIYSFSNVLLFFIGELLYFIHSERDSALHFGSYEIGMFRNQWCIIIELAVFFSWLFMK